VNLLQVSSVQFMCCEQALCKIRCVQFACTVDRVDACTARNSTRPAATYRHHSVPNTVPGSNASKSFLFLPLISCLPRVQALEHCDIGNCLSLAGMIFRYLLNIRLLLWHVCFSSAVEFLRLHKHAAAEIHAGRHDRRKYVASLHHLFSLVNHSTYQLAVLEFRDYIYWLLLRSSRAIS